MSRGNQFGNQKSPKFLRTNSKLEHIPQIPHLFGTEYIQLYEVILSQTSEYVKPRTQFLTALFSIALASPSVSYVQSSVSPYTVPPPEYLKHWRTRYTGVRYKMQA